MEAHSPSVQESVALNVRRVWLLEADVRRHPGEHWQTVRVVVPGNAKDDSNSERARASWQASMLCEADGYTVARVVVLRAGLVAEPESGVL